MKIRFKRTVDSGDLEGTRISLSNEMMLDPRGESFNEMREYAEVSLPNLYEAHDGGILDWNRDNWNEEHLFSTKNALDDNFSKERLDYYFNVAKVVLKGKATNLDHEKRMSIRAQDNFDSQEHVDQQRKMNSLYIGLTLGGLIVGGTGLVIGKTIIATIGFVGAAFSGCLLYNEKRK